MKGSPQLSFAELEESLSQLGGIPAIDSESRVRFRSLALPLQTVDLSRDSLSELIEGEPSLVPILGLAVGLSQEALKNILRHRLHSGGWTHLARRRSAEVVRMLDEEFNLVSQLKSERAKTWDYTDILLERAGSRGLASRAISRGRALEDKVERVVGPGGLQLPYELRTRFTGTAGRTASCDVAIPAGADRALIVIAIKGFDSTGSKLSDAVREIEAMADVRQPRQFVYAVVDGIGWKSRRSDLRRIYNLWANHMIDGVYPLAYFDEFKAELENAAHRLGVL
jgi:hypothetical protein